MPIIPLVVCHVDTHRVIPHRFHVVNSHVSILLLVAEHRIFTCDVNATWINGTNRYKRNGHFARRSKKERWVGGGERGKISLAHTHVSNSCTRKQYIYGVEEIRWPKSKYAARVSEWIIMRLQIKWKRSLPFENYPKSQAQRSVN